MTPPTVRINTLLQAKPKTFVDTLSKIYVIGGLLVGINRLPILTDHCSLIVPSLIYSASAVSGILYLAYNRNIIFRFDILVLLNVTMYVFCVFYNLITYKRMRRYYDESNNFDMEVGCRPKADRLTLRCFVQMCIIIVYIFVMFFTPYGIMTMNKLFFHILPVHIAISSELHYYGHVVSLLLPRLRLINYYMQISLKTEKNVKTSISDKYVFFKYYNEKSNCNMKKIMDLYYIIFQVHNYLIEAMKWQILVIILTTFIIVLGVCYDFSLNIVRGERVLDNVVSDLCLGLILMVPLFAPCVSGDHIQSEVRRLRELIASRLYENKLDKSSRSIARALLEFTENRDLSLRLIQILDVDVSLPFKFVGLLVTYLIILMQFDKVINP